MVKLKYSKQRNNKLSLKIIFKIWDCQGKNSKYSKYVGKNLICRK